MNIFPAFFFLVALWISVFNHDYTALGEDSSEVFLPSPTQCLNCTVCQPPCPPLPPPLPPSGYPSYRASPPPPSFAGYPSYGTPPPPSLPGYPSYGAPPPPSHPVQANCPPPPVPVPCCQYPSHPNPNEYIPLDDDHSPTPYSPLPSISIVILLLSFTVLF